MAAETQSRCRHSGESWRQTVHLHAFSGQRTSSAIARLHEEFKRRIKTQTVLPSAETAAILFWALLASGWRSLSDQVFDLPA
jgi:transposase-like protein